MSTLEHGYTLRGGPFNGRKFNYSGFVDYWGPESDHGPYSRACDEVHNEHAEALLDFLPEETHSHEYDYGTDHPDYVNYAGTRYVSAIGWKGLSISATSNDSI